MISSLSARQPSYYAPRLWTDSTEVSNSAQESIYQNLQFALPSSHSNTPKPHPHILSYQELSTPLCEANGPAPGQTYTHARFPVSFLGRSVRILSLPHPLYSPYTPLRTPGIQSGFPPFA